MSQVHPYRVSVEWSGAREGSGKVKGEGSGIELPLGVPKEFGGNGSGTNPEELLASAVASCYTITFGIIAGNRKLSVQSIRATAVGEVEQTGMQFTYKSMTIKPEIVLAPSASDEEVKVAEDMAHKADLYCIITNAVRDKVSIQVEPNITRG